MNHNRFALTVIALLFIISTVVLALTESTSGVGIWLYALVAVAVMGVSRSMPDLWLNCLFDASSAWRAALTQRLLTQMAALVCLLSAQTVSGTVSTTLSITGLLLFIHTLVLARLFRRPRPVRH
ncbi:hypothetical protein AB1J88_07065 [Pseudomonas sp. S8]|uniref:hypothetical protein n=1 Tax=Pseudomonas sp. S8 TaxID=211136 RepID=UPI003D2E14F0